MTQTLQLRKSEPIGLLQQLTLGTPNI